MIPPGTSASLEWMSSHSGISIFLSSSVCGFLWTATRSAIRIYRADPSRPPVLLLCGEEDAVCPVEENAVVLYDKLAGSGGSGLSPLASTDAEGAEEKIVNPTARSLSMTEESAKGEEPTRNEKTLRGVLSQAFRMIYRGIVKEKSLMSETSPEGKENREEVEKIRKQVLKNNQKDSRSKVTLDIVPRTGHNCMLEDPYTTNRLIWNFVEQVRK